MYQFFISIHFIAIVAWFAGLFYLPRLFVYHVKVDSPKCYDLFCLMESRLYKIIMIPSMIVVLVTGVALIAHNSLAWFKQANWLHLKLVFVVFLIAYHHYLGYVIKIFKQKKNTKSDLFYRILNEIPTIFLIAIIFIAKFKLSLNVLF